MTYSTLTRHVGPQLRQFDDPILSMKCDPVQHEDELTFLNDMRRVCHDNRGVGLAAPQIGVALRVIFVMPKGAGRCFWMINPSIVDHSKDQVEGEEGCLSYPGVRIQVPRWGFVGVEYLDHTMRPQRSGYVGWEARIIQHEIDHLDGICRVGDAWREQGAGGSNAI